jgi:putative transcriptional regulator
MTALRPDEEICLHYAAGVIDPALALLMDLHMAHAPETAARVAALRVGFGTLLSCEQPVDLADDAFARLLDRLDQLETGTRDECAPARARFDDQNLRWRWAGPGRRIAPVDVPGSRFKTFALDVGPGRAMLAHSHSGQEWTLVLRGAYRDERVVVGVGDFVEEDSDTAHRPVADSEHGCLCLVVLTAPLAVGGLNGAVARWLLR